MLKKKFFKTKNEAEITFQFGREDVKDVALVGEFNNWEPTPMKFNKKNKVFQTKMRLPKNNEFEFRYLLDGEKWENDTAADDYVANQHGTENSIVSTIA